MLRRLWADEGGAILSAELILIMTLLVIGMIVGLKALQSAIVTKLGDVVAAIASLNTSFSFTGAQAVDNSPTGNGAVVATTAGSSF